MTRGGGLGAIRSFGEASLLVEVTDTPGRDSARRVHALAAAVHAAELRGVRSVTPGLATLLVDFDPLAVERPTVEEAVRYAAARATEVAANPRVREIPVVYGGEFGPDLPEVAHLTGLSQSDVARRHAATDFEVLLLGFAPGFPYLAELPAELEVPRLSTPRTRTPAGSVAVTGRYSGIYPVAAPGGWRVIGRTPLRLFDPAQKSPSHFKIGDAVRFRSITRAEFEELSR